MDSPYKNWISIDVETGDLISSTKRAVFDVALTEIALVSINQDLEIVDKASWLIKPYKEGLIYAKGAEIASGISKQMVEEQGYELSVVIKGVIDFFKKNKVGGKLPVVLGHNMIRFDAPFIINMFEFCKEDLSKYIQPKFEDTLEWGRMCWTTSNNYKLGTCCENAGITLVDAHRALTDATSTAALWIYFQKRLRGEGQVTISESITTTTKTFREQFQL